MQKKNLSISLLSLFLINFASAYGYYSGSLGDALDRIDPSAIVLGLLFLIAFAFLNWILGRYFKDNRATAGVIAFASSLLIIYGLYRSGFDTEGFFGDFGVGTDLIYTFIPLILLAGIIYLFWKFKKKALLIIGLLLIGLSFFAYEKEILWLIGGVLIIIWALWALMGKVNKMENRHSSHRASDNRLANYQD